MKTAAEWSNDYFFGKKISTIAELVREVRAEALEAAAKEATNWEFPQLCLAAAIRQLKEQP